MIEIEEGLVRRGPSAVIRASGHDAPIAILVSPEWTRQMVISTAKARSVSGSEA